VGGLDFLMLGEPELWAAGRRFDLGSPQHQVVLAALLVDANRPVGVETLIGRVWGDAPPHEARNIIYSRMSRIRRLLREVTTACGGPPVRIHRRAAGYVLDMVPDAIDMCRFVRLTNSAGRADIGDGDRAALLRRALGLWRGTPLAGLTGPWAERTRNGWRDRRLDATTRWAEVELRLGRAAVVVTELPELLAEHPLVEPLHAVYLRALQASGRSAEALEYYAVTRRRLVEDLGTEPGGDLRAAHRAVLCDQPVWPGASTIDAASRVSANCTEPACSVSGGSVPGYVWSLMAMDRWPT
jgi:DNA-binding SARP family transcriptional activator